MTIMAALLLLFVIGDVIGFRSLPVRPVLVANRMRMVVEHADMLSSTLSLLADKSHLWLADSALLASPPSAADVSAASNVVQEAAKAVSPYQKVDNTGFIGAIAGVIETAIDFGHTTLKSMGMRDAYGLSIIIFTCLIKAATLPLTSAQIESTSKLQSIQPLQAKIQTLYAKDENAKNQLLAQLFAAANVNPLAGCLPALVQIPVFLSLYRALTNLIAENKLNEPFLWIPNLEGPVFQGGEATGGEWLTSIFSASGPSLGWDATLAYLSLPAILFVSQTLSQKVLTPPRDPNRPMTEQEEISLGIVNNLPFIVAFFSVNVPAGLGIYWVFNNIITTFITILLKQKFKNDTLPQQAVELMAQIDAGTVVIQAPGQTPDPFAQFNQQANANIVDTTEVSSSSSSMGELLEKINTVEERTAPSSPTRQQESLRERADRLMLEALEAKKKAAENDRN